MSQQKGNLPSTNEGWFEHHVIEALNELKDGQAEMTATHERMHTANIERIDSLAEGFTAHQKEDREAFTEIKVGMESLQPVKKIVYSAVGIILAVVLTAFLYLVVNKH